jgi:hypothetical protein
MKFSLLIYLSIVFRLLRVGKVAPKLTFVHLSLDFTKKTFFRTFSYSFFSFFIHLSRTSKQTSIESRFSFSRVSFFVRIHVQLKLAMKKVINGLFKKKSIVFSQRTCHQDFVPDKSLMEIGQINN